MRGRLNRTRGSGWGIGLGLGQDRAAGTLRTILSENRAAGAGLLGGQEFQFTGIEPNPVAALEPDGVMRLQAFPVVVEPGAVGTALIFR